jgi:hypothetical protein
MVVHGGMHTSVTWTSYQLRSEIDRAREETAQLALSSEQRSSVQWAFAGAAAQATSARPDKGRIAALLARAVEVLKSAGALATAEAGLIVALRRAAALLGAQGATVLAVL